MPTVSPSMTTELISTAPLARSKRKIRTFAGDVAYLRKGQGPAVLLLHGIPSSSYLWRDVIDPLSGTFDVLAPDLLGYGDSDKRLDADLSIAAQARYMVAFMETLGVHQAAVIGHDIGGGVAQFAILKLVAVAAVVLLIAVADRLRRRLPHEVSVRTSAALALGLQLCISVQLLAAVTNIVVLGTILAAGSSLS